MYVSWNIVVQDSLSAGLGPVGWGGGGPENLDMSCGDSSGNPHRDDDSVQSLSYKLFFHEGYFTQITNA